jgi:hypothetical protein
VGTASSLAAAAAAGVQFDANSIGLSVPERAKSPLLPEVLLLLLLPLPPTCLPAAGCLAFSVCTSTRPLREIDLH